MSVVLPRPAYSPEGETGAAVTPPTVAPAPAATETPLATASPASSAALPAASPDVSAREDAGSSVPAVEPAAPADAKDNSEFAPTLMEAAQKPADAKPEAKPEGEKPADAPNADAQAAKPEAPPEAPPTYALQFPEDVKADSLDQERMSAFTNLLGEDRVKPENAQKLLDMHIAEVKDVAKRVETAISERQWNVFRDQQNAWKDEVMTDPVLGGSRFDTAMRTCATVIEQYGGTREEVKALWDDLRATGMGNSPRLLKLFHRLGESFGREASMVPASPARTAQLSGRERGMARYGNAPNR